MNQGFFHGDYFFEGFGQCRNMRVLPKASQEITSNWGTLMKLMVDRSIRLVPQAFLCVAMEL